MRSCRVNALGDQWLQISNHKDEAISNNEVMHCTIYCYIALGLGSDTVLLGLDLTQDTTNYLEHRILLFN